MTENCSAVVPVAQSESSPAAGSATRAPLGSAGFRECPAPTRGSPFRRSMGLHRRVRLDLDALRRAVRLRPALRGGVPLFIRLLPGAGLDLGLLPMGLGLGCRAILRLLRPLSLCLVRPDRLL